MKVMFTEWTGKKSIPVSYEFDSMLQSQIDWMKAIKNYKDVESAKSRLELVVENLQQMIKTLED